MKSLIISGAARIAAQIQNVGANFDFEVLSLPGGSLIAVLLWLYSSAAGAVKRASPLRAAARSSKEIAKPSLLNTADRLQGLAPCTGCGCK